MVRGNDFLFFNSLLLLLIAGVWGVTSVTGAAIGGFFMMYLPVARSEYESAAGLMFVLLAVGAIVLGRDPNGLANRMFQIPRFIQSTLYPFLAERFPGMALKARELGARNAGDEDEELLYTDDADVSDHEEVDSDAVAAR